MKKQDFDILLQRTRDDGNRLFGVCEFIYKTSIVVIFLIGILGGIVSLAAMKFSMPIGLGMLLAVAAICFVLYMMAVLSTHVAKVMVHTSFAAVGILDYSMHNPTSYSNEKNASPNSFDNSTPKSKQQFDTPQDAGIADEFDSIYIEGNKLVRDLSKYGYSFVKYDRQNKKWVIAGNNSEFDLDIYQLRDLKKNFE